MSNQERYMNDYHSFMQSVISPNQKPEKVSYMDKFNRDEPQQYPDDPMCLFLTQLEKINLDQEMEKDIATGRGFRCSAARSIKNDIKDPNGIFSPKFGQSLGDQNPFIDRYKCECGYLRSRINHNIKCPKCGTRVKYVDDDFTYFGWLVLDNNVIIHPILYMQIEFLFGPGSGKNSKLFNIINMDDKKDQNGFSMEITDTPKNEPFYGIGMIAFHERFDEILDYYGKLYPNKREYYNQIVQDRDKVFTHSIPVYTTHLRPFQVVGKTMQYEGTNGIYNMMNRCVSEINRNKTGIQRHGKSKNESLRDLQMKYMELYNEIINILEGKKGVFRNLVSGRYNYTGRSVIIQDPSLEIDQVILSYYELVIVLEQRIINILHRSYNMTFNEAYNVWYRAQIKIDPRIKEIINSIIHSSCNGRGLPILVNRNPTLGYGSILCCFCVGMTDSFVMKLPLRVLAMMNADFDGDALNILHIINNAFFVRAYEIYNPRNAMQISRNDGLFNNYVCIQRDTLLNVNQFSNLGRDHVDLDQYEMQFENAKQAWGM